MRLFLPVSIQPSLPYEVVHRHPVNCLDPPLLCATEKLSRLSCRHNAALTWMHSSFSAMQADAENLNPSRCIDLHAVPVLGNLYKPVLCSVL